MLNKLKRAALGAHTPHDKATAASKPVPMPLPAQVRILMSQHIGAPAKALVKKGDEVFVGTKIGEAGGFVSANIHSSVSGTVAAVEPFRLSNGRTCDSVVIKTDGKQTVDPAVQPPVVTDKASFMAAVRECGLVGLGGAGFPTDVKLQPKQQVDTLLINASECEVWLTSDTQEMLNCSDDIIRGIKAVLQEDFFGDMDFKVAGTHDGITAIQMDIKIHGLTRQIVEEAIARTKQAREYILTEVMEKAIAEPRKTVGEFAPKIIQMMIDPQKIGEVVGQRGKTINAIIDETGVKIDITDDGAVSICGTEQAMMDQAKKYIEIIASDFTEGQILTGKVVSIKDFGAFLEFAPGKEGLVHISKLAKQRVEKVEDVVSLGDVVKVVCMGKDKMGRVSFSIKDVPADAK